MFWITFAPLCTHKNCPGEPRPIFSPCRAAQNGTSSTMGPRAMLISTASDFISDSSWLREFFFDIRNGTLFNRKKSLDPQKIQIFSVDLPHIGGLDYGFFTRTFQPWRSDERFYRGDSGCFSLPIWEWGIEPTKYGHVFGNPPPKKKCFNHIPLSVMNPQ